MVDLKIARIEPARVSAGRTEWDRDRRPSQQDSRKRRPNAHHHLLASLLPGRDPYTCEVDYVVDSAGDLVALLVRDTRSGVVIARVPAAELAAFGAGQASSGLLYERRG